MTIAYVKVRETRRPRSYSLYLKMAIPIATGNDVIPATITKSHHAGPWPPEATEPTIRPTAKATAPAANHLICYRLTKSPVRYLPMIDGVAGMIE